MIRGMGKTLWAMIKDGLKAFLLWVVASALLIYFFKYPGMILSGLLGLILVASFCALWGAQLLFWLLRVTGSVKGGGPPSLPSGGPNQNASPGSAPSAQGRPCLTCGGIGTLTCNSCNGSGWQYVGQQTVTCSVCAGLRSLSCTTCSGGGHVYW
jgi:hypothetical protein